MTPRSWRKRNQAGTHPAHPDPRLRGRTYTIPFDRVWNAALALAGEESGRWRVTTADDERGTIDAEATSLIFRFVDDVQVRVRLDNQGQTRVDMSSKSRTGGYDFGVNTRRIVRFFRSLDQRLQVSSAETLDRVR